MSLFEKSLRLLSEYKCVPSNNGGSTENRECADNRITEIHRELVDEYNSMLDRYIKIGIITDKKIAANSRIRYAM